MRPAAASIPGGSFPEPASVRRLTPRAVAVGLLTRPREPGHGGVRPPRSCVLSPLKPVSPRLAGSRAGCGGSRPWIPRSVSNAGSAVSGRSSASLASDRPGGSLFGLHGPSRACDTCPGPALQILCGHSQPRCWPRASPSEERGGKCGFSGGFFLPVRPSVLMVTEGCEGSWDGLSQAGPAPGAAPWEHDTQAPGPGPGRKCLSREPEPSALHRDPHRLPCRAGGGGVGEAPGELTTDIWENCPFPVGPRVAFGAPLGRATLQSPRSPLLLPRPTRRFGTSPPSRWSQDLEGRGHWVSHVCGVNGNTNRC